MDFLESGPVTQDLINTYIGETRSKYHVPAIAVSLINSEEVFLQEIQGDRALDNNEPARLDDFFHIGSCSKSVLALIAARFIEEQKISWQSQFFDTYPELKSLAREEYLDIRLEDLFHCEAGMQPYTSAAEEFPEIAVTEPNLRLAFLKHLVSQPPATKQKGGRFKHLYSNASYTMASAMLERVAGMDYENLVKKALEVDLGMPIHIGWPNSLDSHQPWGHQIDKKSRKKHSPDSDIVEVFPPGHEYRLPYLLTPAGDLSFTPKDYARYTQLHLRGLRGENNYISSDAYKQIHFGHRGFSLGVANGVLAGKRYSAFDGSAGTFFCRSVIFPESNFALAIMMNAGSGGPTMRAMDQLTLKIVKTHFNWWWKFWF